MNMTTQPSMFASTRENNDGYYLVEQLRTQRAHKIATLRHDDMTELTVPLPRHACVSEHDTLIIRGNSIYVKTHDHAVSVFPAFRYETQVKFGASTHTLVVREITNEQDYEAYCNLRQFHYLSNKSLEDEESEYSQSHSSHESDTGRHVALYAELTINGRKYSAGYTDLGASLLGHPVRIKIFDEDYHDPERNLSMKFEVRHRDLVQVSNRTCRMRRIVVHPDFRSIGLTHLITNAALEYARTRYVFGGYCAHFCESSAEMLNYVPFRHREGWHFGGMSMGNHDKIIGYLKVEIRDHGVNALDRSVSEMQTRKKWGRIFLHYCESRGISFDEGLQLVQRFLDDDDNAAHDVETWAMLRSITVDSKPYYMLGLSDYANEYIKRAISTITFRAKEQKYFDRITRAHDVIERDVKIECKRLTVRAKYELLDNRVTRSLLNAFGLSGRAVYSNILENVRFEASSGDVIMVVGGSGCGKSMLLDCLDTSHEAHDNLDVRLSHETQLSSRAPARVRCARHAFRCVERDARCRSHVFSILAHGACRGVRVDQAVLDAEPRTAISRHARGFAFTRRRRLDDRRVLRRSRCDFSARRLNEFAQTSETHKSHRNRRSCESRALRRGVATDARRCDAHRREHRMAHVRSIHDSRHQIRRHNNACSRI